MAVLPIGIGSEEGGYQIERSLRFNSADSPYLDHSVATSGNLRKWTVSCWVKRAKLGSSSYLFTQTNEDGSGANIKYTLMYFNSSDQLVFSDRWGSSPGDEYITTTAVFRDPSAWYHVVFVRDSDNATQADRAIIYVNGVRQTVTGSFTQSKDSSWNLQTTAAYGQQNSGRQRFAGTWYYGSGFYMTEAHSIDGQALDPTSFGETDSDTGVWKPKAYSGSYGTNGFYLDFADNSSTTALGYDAAGSNDWTPNNFSVTAGAGNDSLVDTPTQYGTDTGAGGEVRGNYCTLNPLDKGALTLSNGNLQVTYASASWVGARATMSVPKTGQWKWEVTPTTMTYGFLGVAPQSANVASNGYTATNVYAWYLDSGEIRYSNSNQVVVAAASAGDTCEVRIDDGEVSFYRNGTLQHTFTQLLTDISADYFPAVWIQSGAVHHYNFGQRPFAHTASGFKALCTTNLPEPTIADGGEYFNAVLWTGDGTAPKSFTGVGFQPDLVWIKARSAAYWHQLTDAVRGVNKALFSNATDAETTTNAVSAFGTDGFTINNTDVNGSGVSYVAWNWKANGSGVSNTDGSITSTVSANPTAGFSIVTYTGNGTSPATIGHGLGIAPSMIIVKSRGTTDSWGVYHASLGNTGGLYLAGTNAFTVSSAFWNNTSPTSTVFTTSNNSFSNSNGVNYVAYCFAPIAGYSAFGSYTGNGSSDGPFVYTGFRPKFVLVKRSSAAGSWGILDSTRSPENAVNETLYPNLSNAESTATDECDFLSNGFKLRSTGSISNDSGATHIYAAFAENPFKYSLAR